MNSNDETSIVSVDADGIVEGCRNYAVSVLNNSTNRSTVKIDSLSINLGIIKEKVSVQKCRHFSIRGYTAGRRENGSSRILRFTEELPPMDIPNFKYWLCQGCLQYNGTTNPSASGSLETPFIRACDQCRVRPGPTSCTTQDLAEVAIVPFDVGTSGSKAVDHNTDDDERDFVADDTRASQKIDELNSVDTNVSAVPDKKVSNDLKNNEELQETSLVKETESNLVSQPIESGQQSDCPNGHPRRKARKVRLLKELLCGKAEIQQQKKENSSPFVAVSTQIKRKMLPDHDHDHHHHHGESHHVQDHDQNKKVKSFNMGNEIGIAKNNVVELRTDPVARENGESLNKFQSNKPKSSNLGKHGSDAMTAWRSIFSDMGRTDNQIPSSYGVSKGRGTEHYSNFMAPPKPDKKLNALKKISTNKPHKSKFFGEDSRRMLKDHQSDTELGLGLSLNYDRQEQVRSLPLPPNRTPNQDQNRKAGFFLGESSNFSNLKEGSVHDVSNRSHPSTTAVLQEQRLYTPISYGNCSGHQKLDFSNPNKRTNGVRGYSDVTRPHNHQRQENMFSIGRSDEREIIELMAKNQYERSLGENRPQFLPISSNQNGIVVPGFRKVNMNAGTSPSHHEYLTMIRPSSENVGPTNIRNQGFTMFDGLTQSQKQPPSNGMWMPESAPPRHYDSRYQHVSNGNNRGGSHTRVYNPTNMQVLEAYNSCNSGYHHNGTVNMPFGQTYATNMDNDKGKTMIDLDLNVVAPNAVEDHNFTESLNLKNPKHVGPLDSSYANDAIPAMQLLSLMDAGKSSQPFSMNSQKLIPKPPSPCYGQCRSTVTGKTNPIVNPHVTYSSLRPGVHNPIGTSFSSVFQNGQNVKMNFSHGQQAYYKPQEDKSRGCRPDDSYTFPLPWHATEDRYKQVNRVFRSRFDSSATEICTVNLNPADFSLPGPENIYMIGVEDLKYKGKYVSGNTNGPKKQRLDKVH
ncbi:uncharacterized protein [Rutidosis leptorrhynchoides]|uniref:uncharacterized protein n=1 Tax=Rutidosis leptorrhynchoides TaxID=125765 RepID=UPI003A99DA94